MSGYGVTLGGNLGNEGVSHLTLQYMCYEPVSPPCFIEGIIIVVGSIVGVIRLLNLEHQVTRSAQLPSVAWGQILSCSLGGHTSLCTGIKTWRI